MGLVIEGISNPKAKLKINLSNDQQVYAVDTNI